MTRKLLAMGLCAVLMLLSAVPVAADEQTNVQWTEFNSIIVELVTEKSCSFTPEDFPEVDCIATITGEKHVDDEGVRYVVVLVLSQSGDAAVEEAIAKAKTNPMVLYAGINNSHELWDYQFSLNHSNYVLRLGETVEIKVASKHRPVMPGVVRCIRFVVDRNYIDDNEETIVETFAKYGINHFWIDREYHEGDSRYENIRSEQGVYFASVEPGRTSYEMIAPLMQSDGFKEVEFVMGWITGGISLGGTWYIDEPKLADMTETQKGGVVISARKPGTVVVTREQNYYGKNPTQTCTITILDEYTPGDVTMDAHVNAVDALRTLQYAVELIALGQEEISLADMDGNGKIDAGDALMILKKAVRKL